MSILVGLRSTHQALLDALESWADEEDVDSKIFDAVFSAASAALINANDPTVAREGIHKNGDEG